MLDLSDGGITPLDIEAATALPKGVYRQMEQRYRAVGDDESIRLLADFYGVPFEDLRWRLDWPRKALSRAVVTTLRDDVPITLQLWNGETVRGKVKWWDLGALGLDIGEPELLIVQRHTVERWEPRAPDPPDDEDSAGETEEA